MLAGLAAACARRARPVTLLAATLALLGLWVIATRLGVDTDTDDLFAKTLPWQQVQAELARAFPQNDDLLVMVIDSVAPEAADATARDLARALSADPHFSAVRRPDDSPYLTRNGLLFLDRSDLVPLLDQTVDAQPFLGALAADPTLRGLSAALSLLAEGVLHGQADLTPFAPALLRFHAAFVSALSPHPEPLSWQTLLAGKLAALAGPYRFVLATPRLDEGTLQPGADAIRAVRNAARKLEFVQSGAAHVRITGAIALDQDEFATIVKGTASGFAGAVVLVTVWLFLAVTSWRLVLPILLTVLFGLEMTTGFAALALGTLNLVSVAFAVLFIGLSVDFAIQFTVSLRDARCRAPDLEAALGLTAQRAGSQILVAALASAAGFLAFTPADFRGVAQLGLIAGVGMLIAFACTLTVLPALLDLFRPPQETGAVGFAPARRIDEAMIRHRVPILAGAALVALAGLALLPRLPFDADPLHAKNHATESVRALDDMATNPLTNPYTIDVLAPSVAAAATLAERLSRLASVQDALTLDSLVPDDQAAKLPLIADAASLLLPTLSGAPHAAPADAASLRAAVTHAAGQIAEASKALPPGHTLIAIGGDLRTLQQAPDAVVLAASQALTRFLPEQLAVLSTALTPVRVIRADVPADLARDWVAPDGRARISVLPKPSFARNNAGLHRFVGDVTGAAPGAGGAAVAIVRSAETIVSAFRNAALGGLVAIVVILLAALRRPADVARVLAPLLLSALATAIGAVLLPVPLNFANIIALPLLLGLGVSFNVYVVMNWRAGCVHPLSSPTARAVLLSGLTTATAFGPLALSSHPGTASLGRLLLLSLTCTVLVTLLVLPALLGRRA